ADRDPHAVQAVDDAGDRLDEGRHLVGHLADGIDVRGRSDDVLGEASVPGDAGRVPVQAVVPLAALAEEARAAEQRRVDGDAITFADDRLDRVRRERDDLAGELVSNDQRVRREEVAFVDVVVGAADPARRDTDEDLVLTGPRIRRFADVELATGLVEGGLHLTAPNVRPRTRER